MATKKNQDEIGALWINRDKNGDRFLAGDVEINQEKVRILVFKNGFKKEGSNDPDFRVHKPFSEKKPEAKKPTRQQDEDDLV